MTTFEREEIELAQLQSSFSQRLSLAEDEKFLAMLWAANAIQSDREQAGLARMRKVPQSAINAKIESPHAVHGWYLETLANELLATPKHGFYRSLDVFSWQGLCETVDHLKLVEDAEYGARKRAFPILRELYRIGGRQFEWQFGFLSVRQLYRYLSVYGQGECAAYFEERHGLSIADMTAVGYALLSIFLESATCPKNVDLQLIGIAPEVRHKALALLSAPLETVRARAAAERLSSLETAYRPSILRQFPCIAVGPRRKRLIAPLPDLIISRITSGLFYDLLGSPGGVRNEYGRRFEAYAIAYLQAMLPQISLLSEWRYKVAKRPYDTPDILLTEDDGPRVEIAIECKATRMSYTAQFGQEAGEEKGYDQMVKALCQLWRFFAHCRLGWCGSRACDDAIGIVLTLDSWFVMGMPLQEDIEARALEQSRRLDPEVLDEDRRPIFFCSMADLERTLRFATPASFRAAARLAVNDSHRGWLFSMIHREVPGRAERAGHFPFTQALGEILPWWARLSEQVQTDELAEEL